MSSGPKILINIQADNVTEYREILSGLLGGMPANVISPEVINPPTTALEDQTASEVIAADPPKPARKPRRTKAQIAADKASADAAPPETAAGPTLDDVSAKMRDLYAAGEGGGEHMVKILTDLGAVNSDGETKVSAMPEDKFAEAMEIADKAIAAMGADKANTAEGAFG